MDTRSSWAIAFVLVLALVLQPSLGQSSAMWCNPEDLKCPGNVPVGNVGQEVQNPIVSWFNDMLGKTGLFTITSGGDYQGTQSYSWSSEGIVLNGVSKPWSAPAGVYDQCEIVYQCGSSGTPQHQSILYFVISQSQYTKYDIIQRFTCSCATTGKVYARLVCGISPIGRLMTDFEWMVAVPCTGTTTVPTSTPVPAPTGTPLCTPIWSSTICKDSNTQTRGSTNCFGIPQYYDIPCDYGCFGGVCRTSAPVTTTPTVAPTATPTPAPTIPGCVPVFNAGFICEDNIQWKTATNCGSLQKEAIAGCQYGCSQTGGGVCASAPQPTTTPTATVVPTATQGPTPKPTTTFEDNAGCPSGATPIFNLDAGITCMSNGKIVPPASGKYPVADWKVQCGVSNLDTLCPKGITDVEGTTWKADGCPSQYRCISETPSFTPTHPPGPDEGDGITASTKGFLGGIFDSINNFFMGIFGWLASIFRL